MDARLPAQGPAFAGVPLHPALSTKRRLPNEIPDLTQEQLAQQRARTFTWFGRPHPLSDEELAILAAMQAINMHSSEIHDPKLWALDPEERWPTMNAIAEAVVKARYASAGLAPSLSPDPTS